jgi:hypothetical protein
MPSRGSRPSRILRWIRRRRFLVHLGLTQHSKDDPELTVLDSALPALELPGREAGEVNVHPLNTWRSAVVRELDLELHLSRLIDALHIMQELPIPAQRKCGQDVAKAAFHSGSRLGLFLGG